MTAKYNTIKKMVDLDVAEMILNNRMKLRLLLHVYIYTLLKNVNQPYSSPPSTSSILDWLKLSFKDGLTLTMMETLQAHQHVTPKARVSLLTCSAYKNVLKTYSHQTAPSLELLIPNNMENVNEARNQIKYILDRVRSLDDLSADDIAELRCISQQSLIIDKFKISRAQYWDWVAKVGDDIRGVEFNAQDGCIILKEYPGWMHEAATHLLSRLFIDLEDRLSAATGSYYDSTGSTST